MRKFTLVIGVILLFSQFVEAQQPKKPNASEIHEAIKKLNFLGSVLYVAAHPDDENTRLISYLSNHVKARTAYLSLTRGDGGQNLIGPEIRELLGVIRTQELLAARRTDGGMQMFTRANDFGFSKHPNETLSIWDKKEVLSDVVWAIRKFKPDVIINRFDHRTPGTTHGHHTTSAMLSVEAFDMTDNKDIYPDQLQYVKPWQPKRLFFNTSWWFYGSRENFEKADKTNIIKVNSGVYYPVTGLSNTEIASLSRSKHKSQGFGSTGTRGSQNEYVELIKGDLPKDKKDLFAGIDTSWNRVKGGKEIGTILKGVEENFDFRNPASSVPKLVEAYQLIQQLEDTHWKTIKSKEIKEIIEGATGLYLEAVTAEPTSTKGDQVQLKIEAINRSSAVISLKSLQVKALGLEDKQIKSLKNNERLNIELKGNIPKTIDPTNPYWLNEKGTLGMYSVQDRTQIGDPETNHKIKATFIVTVEDVDIPIIKDVVYKTNDPVKGEVYKPFEIIPALSASIKDKVIIYANGPTKQIPVTIKSWKNNSKGSISLNHPNGWTVEPAKIDFELSQKGEEKTVTFQLTAPQNQSEGYISPNILANGESFSNEVVTIDYDHIPFQTVVLPSETKVVKLDIQKKGQNIGYIEGAGDVVPESLQQIGYNVTLINPEAISPTNLSSYDAIVIGIRAYNTLEELKFKQQYLLEYVKNGGNLIVQYNTSHRLKVKENLGPFPIKLSRDRVTDENAKITFLAPEHQVLNSPNKITQKDFKGWVQERGLYFPNEWAQEYTAILASNDVGESQKKGSLLVAKYGKGYYVYTGLSFFREFPAGVSGAYRLFANMISLGK
ncbi:PIG-L family deacetylase [Aquimarina sp. D1M17]|uniref:PIG-L family deacetylase n=1 Tax=Aquimarina acroporae TaxID=2937283 RepID=UPI0020BFC338|nr:PIG-L family deacetylase [Aquimarina acroporae]MCK8520604.1 PIG-L family deacetylase [Aquimarina acroporae]